MPLPEPSSRRPQLKGIGVQASTHAGLWLDKFLPHQASYGSKGLHIKEVDKIAVPQGYKEAFERRRQELLAVPPQAGFGWLTAEAKTTGRVIIGLGQKSVLEVGLTLDHTWGVPYLPGSSLKGIAAWAARQSEDQAWKAGGESFLALFGNTDEAGAVRFLDAWWRPEGKLPIHLDTMTVHHPEYYQREKDPPPPSDMDSPTPISFASVAGTFEIMLEGPVSWVDVAMQLLKRGLDEHGIGAKTAGGYGRLSLEYQSAQERVAYEEERIQQKAEALQKQIADITPGNAAQKVPDLLAKATAQDRPQLAQAIIEQLGKKKVREKQDKQWAKELLTAAAGEAK